MSASLPLADPAATARQELRARGRAARAGLSDHQRRAATDAACQRAVAALDAVGRGDVVAVFAAMRDEIDPGAAAVALAARGVAIAYPVLAPTPGPLTFRVAREDQLLPARWQLREPPSTCPEIAPGELAAVVVPGLVFDRAGNRLGWGAGHYDRTLPWCTRAVRVGLAFDAQVIDRLVPAPHDVPVHWIATEVALYPGAPPPGRGTPP